MDVVSVISLEEQIRLHKELSKQIDELEEKKKILGAQILQQMTEKTLKVPGFVVRHCSRLSIGLTVEEARLYDAVKLEETVDKFKLKALYLQGHPIKGIHEVNYIQVTQIL